MKKSEFRQIIKEEIKNYLLDEAIVYGKFEIDNRVYTIKNLEKEAKKIKGVKVSRHPSPLQNHTTLVITAPSLFAADKVLDVWKEEGLDWPERKDFGKKLKY